MHPLSSNQLVSQVPCPRCWQLVSMVSSVSSLLFPPSCFLIAGVDARPLSVAVLVWQALCWLLVRFWEVCYIGQYDDQTTLSFIYVRSVSLHWERRQQHTSTICCSRHDVCKFESKDLCLYINNHIWSQIFSASFASAWGPIGWVYPAEIFPMRARAKGTSCMLMIPAIYIYHRYDN